MEERNLYQIAATRAIEAAVKKLRASGLKWWAEGGTCLGAVRHGDAIPHDTDVDFMILMEDKDKVAAFRQSLEDDKDFHYLHTFGTPENGYEFSFANHGVKIDFFFAYEEGDKLWYSSWYGAEQLFYDLPKCLFDDLKEIEMQGVKFFIPNPPEEYLTLLYGDWQTVNPDWNWVTDPVCLRKT